jgi:hypothetical protein
MIMQHLLSAEVGINFSDMRRSLGRFSSLADSSHKVQLFFFSFSTVLHPILLEPSVMGFVLGHCAAILLGRTDLLVLFSRVYYVIPLCYHTVPQQSPRETKKNQFRMD